MVHDLDQESLLTSFDEDRSQDLLKKAIDADEKNRQQALIALSESLVGAGHIRVDHFANLVKEANLTNKTDFKASVREARKQAEKQLTASSAQVAGSAMDASTGQNKSQTDLLVEIAQQAELFHDVSGDTFARLAVDGHYEVWPTRSKGFRRWLTKAYYGDHGGAPKPDAIGATLNLVEAVAQFDGKSRPVYLRVAPDGAEGVYIDLGGPDWRAIHVTAAGWKVVMDPPVMFRRSPGTGPLPEPTRGGQIDDLRTYVNVPDDSDWSLAKAWLIAALAASGPMPLLALKGEQGSAKSTFARCLRSLVDPAVPSIRRPPRDERDLAIAARSCWLVAYDNISHIQPWLSDALCSFVTGGGFATRELYTDADEVLFAARRPMILNGIEDYVTRGDLADRAIVVTLPAIPDEQRRDERTLLAGFENALPSLFGAVLDSLSGALRALPKVQLDRLPRMADFARLAVAAEQARGEAPRFIQAYAKAQKEAGAATIEGSVIGAPLLQLCDSLPLEKTAGELLVKLADIAGESATRTKDWPKSPRGISGELRRLAPALRRAGVDVEFLGNQGTSRKRLIRLTFAPTSDRHNRSDRSDRSPWTETPVPAPDGVNDRRTVANDTVNDTVRQNVASERQVNGRNAKNGHDSEAL